MGSIIERKRKDGTVAYMAQIMIMRDRKIVFRENKTFERRPAASAWLKRRESELAQPGALTSARAAKRTATLSDAIDKYIRESTRPIGKTKAQVLEKIKSFDIADIPCPEIGSQQITAFAVELRKTRAPSTVANYLSHLSAVFRIARPAWGYELNYDAVRDAFIVGKALGITGRSKVRERRPTVDEMDRLMDHFARGFAKRPWFNPMHRIAAFAMFSTRRLEEITLLRWADLDEEGSRILVRDMKDPGEKEGNNVWCDIPAPALRIIQSMDRTQERIFPYSTNAISAAFTRAVAILDIEDLHFHDLRHEGISRLIEMGLSVPRVAAVSGHRSWTTLKRYTHLRQVGDKWAGWQWLERIAPEAGQQDVATL